MIGLVKTVQLDFGTALISTGVYNVISGWSFGVPMPVQPMKTVAAVAIDQKLSITEICAAGIFVSSVIMFLGLTRWIQVFNLLIPASVIRGIQLAVGYKLALNGAALAFCHGGKFNTKLSLSKNALPFWAIEGLVVSISLLAFFLSTINWTQRAGICGILQPKDVSSALGTATPLPLHGASIVPTQDPEATLIVDDQRPADPRPDHESESEDDLLPAAPQISSYKSLKDGPDASAKGLSGSKRSAVVAAAPLPGSESEKRAPSRLVAAWTWLKRANIPSALIAVILGIILACVSTPAATRHLRLGPSKPKIIELHNKALWISGITKMGLPQLPLSCLNSVVAVVAISSCVRSLCFSFTDSHVALRLFGPDLPPTGF